MRTPLQPPYRVGFLIDEMRDWRGTETHLFRLMTHLDPARIVPVVMVVGPHELAAEFREAEIAFHPLEIYRAVGWSGIKGTLRIARLCRQLGIDLLVSYHTSADLLAPLAGRLAGIPVVSCRRDDGFTKKPRHKALQRWLNPLLAGMISVSHAVTEAVERDERYPVAHNRVIWNGEDLDAFKPGPSPIRTELGLTDGHLVISCVGGLDPVKDHQTLVRAFEPVARRHPECVLLIVGRGERQSAIEAQATALGGQVRLLGYRADIPAILRASDLYVQTSLTEGFSNAIVQAMATALPVVATAVGGNPELIGDESGLLAQPGDAATLAAHLERLATDAPLRRTMGQAARARIEQHASIEKMVRAYQEAFEGFIRGG